ncbi:signal peptidase I [Clostridium transplantifaecale]|uniref:signal peptidase I n=1 Tax=Clostridium transplantifaecale TaxID=2479838 RepID=UPI000F640789
MKNIETNSQEDGFESESGLPTGDAAAEYDAAVEGGPAGEHESGLTEPEPGALAEELEKELARNTVKSEIPEPDAENSSPASAKGKKEKEPINWKAEIISWIQVLVTAALIAFVIDRYIIANSQVPTGSMETTIMPGDRVIGSRLSYTFGEAERGDIAIFVYPDDADKGITTYYVKRVIGMPGDTIDIIDGKIYINGSDTPLDEPYLHEEMEEEPPQHYEVPENSYFMMGDNRNYSNDSRRWKNKFVAEDQLVAKVLFQYFPKIRKLE